VLSTTRGAGRDIANRGVDGRYSRSWRASVRAFALRAHAGLEPRLTETSFEMAMAAGQRLGLWTLLSDVVGPA
jgi:hypothetical protein